jgi:hypothetical protein
MEAQTGDLAAMASAVDGTATSFISPNSPGAEGAAWPERTHHRIWREPRSCDGHHQYKRRSMTDIKQVAIMPRL